MPDALSLLDIPDEFGEALPGDAVLPEAPLGDTVLGDVVLGAPVLDGGVLGEVAWILKLYEEGGTSPLCGEYEICTAGWPRGVEIYLRVRLRALRRRACAVG